MSSPPMMDHNYTMMREYFIKHQGRPFGENITNFKKLVGEDAWDALCNEYASTRPCEANNCEGRAMLLAQCKTRAEHEIIFRCTHLEEEYIELLMQTIGESVAIKTLILIYTRLTDENAILIGDMLIKNKSIYKLIISFDILTVIGRKAIFKGLAKAHNIKVVEIVDCNFNDDEPDYLDEFMLTEKEFICFAGCRFPEAAVKALTNTNRYMEKLTFRQCTINGILGQYIGTLTSNVKTLVFYECRLSTETIRSLFKSLYHNINIQTISLKREFITMNLYEDILDVISKSSLTVLEYCTDGFFYDENREILDALGKPVSDRDIPTMFHIKSANKRKKVLS